MLRDVTDLARGVDETRFFTACPAKANELHPAPQPSKAAGIGALPPA
jgi:hypothetical protein